MHSNYHTFQQHHNTASTNSQQRQRHLIKNTRPTCIPSTIHLSTSNQEDPFANMNAYVDYQQKIESLKTSLVSTKSTAPVSVAVTSKHQDPTRMTRPLNSTKRHHHRRQSLTIDMMGDDDGRFWSNSSVMSSGSSGSSSSSGASSSGSLTPPRSSSPTTTTTCDEQQSSYDSDTCYVTMEDQVRFLAFLRHRTGWHSRTTDTVTDLDYMKNSGSLFFWYG